MATVKPGPEAQEGRPGSLLLSLPSSPFPAFLSSDDSDYDETPEEGPGAPIGVMTKKVGQEVVRVWAVCC